MKATIDSAGRVLLPKALRDSLGLTPGAIVDISAYGSALHIIPGGRTASLQRNREGRLVAVSTTRIDDDVVFSLIDAGRK